MLYILIRVTRDVERKLGEGEREWRGEGRRERDLSEGSKREQRVVKRS
jgi:hypothetical protein